MCSRNEAATINMPCFPFALLQFWKSKAERESCERILEPPDNYWIEGWSRSSGWSSGGIEAEDRDPENLGRVRRKRGGVTVTEEEIQKKKEGFFVFEDRRSKMVDSSKNPFYLQRKLPPSKNLSSSKNRSILPNDNQKRVDL